MDAKRRKRHEAGLDPKITGKDQRVLNRDRKVELTEGDLHQTGIRKWEHRSSTNRDIKVEALNQELQGSRINKRESQSIFNIINAGKQR